MTRILGSSSVSSFQIRSIWDESVGTPPAAPSSPSLTLRSFSSRGWLVIIATFCIDRVILRSFLSVPDRLETPKKNDKYQARTRYYSVVGAT